MDDRPGPREVIRTAIATLADVNAAAVKALDETPDRHGAFAAATDWSAALRDLHDQIGELRSRYAAQIWEAEQLSLQGLADRIGVSKARAGQLIDEAQRQEGRR